MYRILTAKLLDDLVSQGYLYCLSKTTSVVGEDADICITLFPVKQMPLLKDLSENFDAYFEIGKEPRQMAIGVDETIILVDLGEITIDSELSL
jgi:hypothetical protein